MKFWVWFTMVFLFGLMDSHDIPIHVHIDRYLVILGQFNRQFRRNAVIFKFLN